MAIGIHNQPEISNKTTLVAHFVCPDASHFTKLGNITKSLNREC